MTPVSAQRRIGLTGGIASGKSSVARLLAQDHGLPLLDADVEARQALAAGSPAARAVRHIQCRARFTCILPPR
jgi:dephospho-CoA kinase